MSHNLRAFVGPNTQGQMVRAKWTNDANRLAGKNLKTMVDL
jgi:hypothetical protein